MPRGGARQGRPGVSHAQRTDLNVAKLPAAAAPGQTYGEAGRQIASQQQMPMGAQPIPTAPSASASPPVMPGALGAFDRPTDRPDEPLTAGAPVGPGSNNLSLPTPPNPLVQAVAMLNSLGDQLPPELKRTVMVLQSSVNNGING